MALESAMTTWPANEIVSDQKSRGNGGARTSVEENLDVGESRAVAHVGVQHGGSLHGLAHQLQLVLLAGGNAVLVLHLQNNRARNSKR